MKGKHHTEESKRKLREAHKGKELSDETKKKISESIKGKNHPMYGKCGKNCPNYGSKRTEEQKKKMSESHYVKPVILLLKILKKYLRNYLTQ